MLGHLTTQDQSRHRKFRVPSASRSRLIISILASTPMMLVFFTSCAVTAPARASIIVVDTTPTPNGGDGYAGGPGESVLTPSASAGWSNVTFNWFDPTSGSPLATGDIFLLSQAYSGTPSALSSLTAGYIDEGVADSGGDAYIFGASTVLNPNIEYYFYSSNRPNGFNGLSGGAVLAGTVLYNSPGGTGNFFNTGSAVAAFELQGTSTGSTVPEPGTWLMLGTGLIGLGRAARGTRGQKPRPLLERGKPEVEYFAPNTRPR
jgi:hypothetical protein